MAIIPRADESQVISAGSPVPIAGTSEARMMSQAASGLGEAMVNLGAKLSAVDKASTKHREGVAASIASSDFATDLAVLEQEIKTGKDYGNVPSSKMLSKYRESAQKLYERHARNVSDDGETRLFFEQKAKDLISDRGLKFYSNAIKDYNDITKNNLDFFVSKKATEVAQTTDKNGNIDRQALDSAIADTYKHVMDNDIFTVAEKQDYIVNARKELFGAYINGHVQRITSSTSASERERIEKHALNIFEQEWNVSEGEAIPITGMGGVFNEKEKDHFRNAIVDARDKADNKQIQQQNMRESMDQKTIKRTSEKAYRNLGVEILVNVKDTATLNTAMSRIDDAVAKGALAPEKAESLKRMARQRDDALFGKAILDKITVNSLYRDKFVIDILKAEKPDEYVSDVYEATTKYGVSGDAALSLMDSAGKIAEAFRKNPKLRSDMQDAVSTLDKARTSGGIDKLPREVRLEVEKAIRKAKSMLYESFTENPEIDSKKSAHDIFKSQVMPILQKHKLGKPQASIDIMPELKKIADEYKYKLKTRALTANDELMYKEKIRDLIQIKDTAGVEFA